MKKWVLIGLYVVLFTLLGACEGVVEKYQNYTGEGEYWTAEVLLEDEKDRQERSVSFYYQGNNLQFKHFNYKVDSPMFMIAGENKRLNGRGFFSEGGFRSNTISHPNQLIVTIQFGDEEEEIILKPEK
ncbi:hypothetical protein D3H55_14430 [Bacillus salacetis]|uniref:Uncharacterized protein n=1 Tax=Bacillus salacetis TaxID=2315464 RepID=A0A3A1QVF3_9BACI|nr:hypothetical protein [Bacillus salacetis]RIW32063.1 hypothetical protein D3H55_14430 [Bacillus salacetis]